MATTYEIIDKAILTGTQSSVSFTGLGAYSSDYTDLLIFVSARQDRAAATVGNMLISFNSSASNFSGIYLEGQNNSASSGSYGRYCGANPATSATSNTFSNTYIYIPNYSSSNYKSFSVDATTENNATAGAYADLIAGLWSNTAAITSIGFESSSADNFVSGSSFYLYGIKNS